MRHKADATGIVLEAGIIQAVTRREIPGGIEADLVIGLDELTVQRFTPRGVPKLAIGCMNETRAAAPWQGHWLRLPVANPAGIRCMSAGLAFARPQSAKTGAA
jgi:hypothetical protein